MKESGRGRFFIQLGGTPSILGGVFRDKILFVATSLISHEGSQYLLGECWILELVVIVFIFSYCLAGQEALVCDEQKEGVVQVKAQQVLGGEDEKQ